MERGFSAEGSYDFSNLDSISVFNGGLGLHLAIGGEFPIAGNLSVGINLAYASKVWSFESVFDGDSGYLTRSYPALEGNSGLGWRLAVAGRLIPPWELDNETAMWQYIDPIWGRHALYSTLHPFDTPVDGVKFSRDGTYLRLKMLPEGDMTLEFPHGEIHTYDSDGRVKKVEDRYGNHLDISYTTQPHPDPGMDPLVTEWKLEDQHGRINRVHLKQMTSAGEAVMIVDRVEIEPFGGGDPAVYTFETET
ncbi:MAG: hypothetical protein GY856_39375, partial [bacterium]|nr:hypothetical protein [bacterium]